MFISYLWLGNKVSSHSDAFLNGSVELCEIFNRDIKDHLLPTSLPWAGTFLINEVAPSPIQSGFKLFGSGAWLRREHTYCWQSAGRWDFCFH